MLVLTDNFLGDLLPNDNSLEDGRLVSISSTAFGVSSGSMKKGEFEQFLISSLKFLNCSDFTLLEHAVGVAPAFPRFSEHIDDRFTASPNTLSSLFADSILSTNEPISEIRNRS
jgi:hypothetical protein